MPSNSTAQPNLFPFPEKRCGRCGKVKPYTAFSANVRYNDGYFCYCLECMRAYHPPAKRKTMVPDASIGAKQCRKCDLILSLSHFGPDKGRPDGVFPYCNRCRLRDPIKRDVEREQKAKGLRWCSHCQSWKLPADFYLNPSKPDGIHHHCRDCSRAQSVKWAKHHPDIRRAREKLRDKDKRRAEWQAWYAKNRDKVARRSAAYWKTPHGRMMQAKANHNRRLRTKFAPATLTIHEWRSIISQQNNRCVCCGRSFGPNLRPTMDHIVPVTKGGGLTLENTQALCKRCNCSKGAKTIDYRPDPYGLKKGT